MVDTLLPSTRVTLLARLRYHPADGAAWNEFVEHYGRHIYRWCRACGLQDDDAEDVTQDILLRLAGKLHEFAYTPKSSFRGWLKTVARRAWREFAAGQRRERTIADDRAWDSLQSEEAGDDLIQKLEEAFDFELLEVAKMQVRFHVSPHTWEAFRLLTIERLPAADVAALLGMQVAMVYIAKSKVQMLLRGEIRKLEADG